MNSPVLRVSALMIAAAFAQQVAASGYHFGTQSVSAQGTANASGAAVEDASILFYNPAGLTGLKGTHASGILDIVIPKGDYTDAGSHTVVGTKISGNNGGEFVKTTVVPHAYLSHQLNDKMTVGFGMFVPFGAKSTYDKDWVGRYNIISTELKTIALNPSFAFKASEQVSLGFGLTAQHIEGKLHKGADMGAGIAAKVLATPGLPGALKPGLLAMAGNPTYSGDVKIKGDDWGFGWNAGVMFNLDKNNRIGLAYRSKIKHDLKGTADWTVAQTFATNPTLTALGLNLSTQGALNALYGDSKASLAVDTPESLSLSGFTQINERLALMADITRTRHSRFQALTVMLEAPSSEADRAVLAAAKLAPNLAPSNTPENWSDTTKVSIGGSYVVSDALKLRAGLAFDQSPVNDANRTPSIPDGDRKWVSLGANWVMSKDSSMDVAYSFVKVDSGAVNQYDNGGLAGGVCDPAKNTSSCATMIGKYKVSSHIIGLQYNQKF